MVDRQSNRIYNKVKIEFDPCKSKRNARERGFPFDIAVRFNFDTALIRPDTRRDYGEPRYQAFGLIDNRLYFLAFSLRNDAIRVISLRKANAREMRFYDKETKPHLH